MDDVRRSVRIAVFLSWLLIVPAGFVYLALNHPAASPDFRILLPVTILAVLAVYFPVRRNGIPLSLVGWLTLPAFLHFGVLTEAVIIQIALLGTIPGNLKSPDPLHRFFFNSTMTFVLSVVSAGAFHALGGSAGGMGMADMVIPALFYIAARTAGNILFMDLYQKLIGNPYPLNSEIVLLDVIAAIVVFTYGLCAYFLYDLIGFYSLPVLAIPFFSVTMMMRKYDNAERVNDILTQAVELGHEMSGKITQPEVLDLFVRRVPKIVPADSLYIYDIRNGRVEPLICSEDGEQINLNLDSLAPGEGIGRMIYRSGKGLLFNARQEWNDHAEQYDHPEAESLLGTLIVRNRKIEGIVGVMSRRQNVYEEHHQRILELLGSYLSVSLEKARHVQKTVHESERCGLTGLYNYRYMESELRRRVDLVLTGKSKELSFIMLDIDHFKKVNDTYGHQSGNEILITFADLLREKVEGAGNWTVARYGGEEFALVLPDIPKQDALRFAEEIRNEIEQYEFLIGTDEEEPMSSVRITASIGVASVPDDADSAMDVMRNADRALYTGAKQIGRNRVATYSG
ncbi:MULTISPECIES: sensor domain-containing diguanylate cyclase [Bhargavaea]|uniref:Sensor domain-containing diguanylate cyclase n=1 Tax=Bhargavaea changchunensis TaxID=2134037 RepID=A0ABW2NFM2_9BACL|nr:sensor domain-containing diguanylate cyclase [Bhargavaea sp. CC-171006]